MAQTRSLLFYDYAESERVTPFYFDNLPLSETLAAAFDKAVSALRGSRGQPPLETTPSADHDFYDWDLEAIPPATPVSHVPKPGIVLAIKKGNMRTQSLAVVLKLKIEGVTDETQRRLLDSYLNGPKGKFEPATLEDSLSDAVEAKPGAFGFSVDLKKVFKALRRRWRRGS